MPSSPDHPQAFPKHERVRKRADYLEVQGRGRKLVTEHLLVFVRIPMMGSSPVVAAASAEVTPASTVERPRRFGVTVSKKVGCAVERNRVKRRLRELFRRHKAWWPMGRDVVVVAKPSAVGASYQALERELEKACSRSSGR